MGSEYKFNPKDRVICPSKERNVEGNSKENLGYSQVQCQRRVKGKKNTGI